MLPRNQGPDRIQIGTFDDRRLDGERDTQQG